jgi:small GTP-binding protein
MGSRRAADRAFDVRVKAIVVGDSGVGKTALLQRFVRDAFSPTFVTTIGIDFVRRLLRLHPRDAALDGSAAAAAVELQLWDTAGQERFRAISESYFRGAQCAALVYDVGNRASFEHVRSWADSVRSHGRRGAPLVVVANKCDLRPALHAVSRAEGEALAAAVPDGAGFFEASARTGAGVDAAFTALARFALAAAERERERAGGLEGAAVALAAAPPRSRCC